MKNQDLNQFLDGAIDNSNRVILVKLAQNLEGQSKEVIDSVMKRLVSSGLEFKEETVKAKVKKEKVESSVSTISTYFQQMSNHDLISKSDEQEFGKKILDSRQDLLNCFFLSPLLIEKFESTLNKMLDNENYDILANQNKPETNKRNLKKSIANVSNFKKNLSRYLPEINSGKITKRKLRI